MIGRTSSSSSHLLIAAAIAYLQRAARLPAAASASGCKRAACSVMCNSDEMFASNVLGSDWVKESAEAPTSARCDETLPASLGRRAPPASRKGRR